jgi:hypothetical protein
MQAPSTKAIFFIYVVVFASLEREKTRDPEKTRAEFVQI